MDRHSLRRIGAFAVTAIIGLGTAAVTAGPAGAARRVAAGTYTATFPATSTSQTLEITNAPDSTTSGSWAMNNNDAGTWVVQGTTVAFAVSYSEIGHADELLIAKLTASGLGPGQLMVPGQVPQPWSAVRVTTPPPAPRAGAHAAVGSNNPRGAATAAGPYSAQFPTFADTLTLTKSAVARKSGTFTLTTLGDSGNWLVQGKKIVLAVSAGPDTGVLLLGTTSTTSISSADAPGVYYQYMNGTFPWYATRIA